ncbi:MAG: carbohydrate ABC transporter permease [Propionibacteriaceae bacterium]
MTRPPSLTRAPSRRRRQLREYAIFLAFVFPNLALIAMFVYRPLLHNLYFSTLHWTLGSAEADPIGLANYVEFFTSPDAKLVLTNTALFAICTVAGSMLIGLLLALALDQKVIGRTFARASIFAPYILSGVGVGLVWLFIFDPMFGILGYLIRMAGGTSPRWFQDPTLSLVMVIIVYVWKNLGYCAVVYLAGLQGIPRDIQEAAAIDGAGRWQTFWHVTMPLLSPTTFFLLITTILSSLQAFDLIKIMAPSSDGTRTLIYEAYLQAFGSYNRAGYSAAISVILFLILLILTIVQIRWTQRKVHYA